MTKDNKLNNQDELRKVLEDLNSKIKNALTSNNLLDYWSEV